MITSILGSLVVIVIIHYVYLFLRDSLTAPRVRDLVKVPIQKREEIMAASRRARDPPPRSVEAKTEMKAELGAFLKQLQTTSGAPPAHAAI